MLFGHGRLCYDTWLGCNKYLVRQGKYQLAVEPTGVTVELIIQSATPKGCMGGTAI